MVQWQSRNLYVALGGDILPAAYLASWFLQKEIPSWLPTEYTHRHMIQLTMLI